MDNPFQSAKQRYAWITPFRTSHTSGPLGTFCIHNSSWLGIYGMRSFYMELDKN
jgi:hypothetical protein